MLKVDERWLQRVERVYPGIRESIDRYEALALPTCPACGSADTAAVSAGIVGRSVHVSAATTKIRLLPEFRPEDYYCNACGRYFGGPDQGEAETPERLSLLLDPRTATDADYEAFCRAIQAQAAKSDRIRRRGRP